MSGSIHWDVFCGVTMCYLQQIPTIPDWVCIFLCIPIMLIILDLFQGCKLIPVACLSKLWDWLGVMTFSWLRRPKVDKPAMEIHGIAVNSSWVKGASSSSIHFIL